MVGDTSQNRKNQAVDSARPSEPMEAAPQERCEPEYPCLLSNLVFNLLAFSSRGKLMLQYENFILEAIKM